MELHLTVIQSEAEDDTNATRLWNPRQYDFTGNGAFSNLVNYLFSTYPDIVIYVENILSNIFDDKLIRMGFTRTGMQPFCYWKRG